MSISNNSANKKAVAQLTGSTPSRLGDKHARHNSIPSDLTMQSIDSLEELMVCAPENRRETTEDLEDTGVIAQEAQTRTAAGMMVRSIPRPQTIELWAK